PRHRTPPVLRGQPVLGDLVPRRPRRAARRVRPGRPGQKNHPSAADLEGPASGRPRLGAAADDGHLDHRHRALPARGVPGSAVGEPPPGAVRAAGPDPRRHLGRRLAQGPGRPARPDPGHPGALNPVVQGIERTGRRPVLLAENKDELPGQPRQVVDLLTTQEAHNLTAPPTRTWLIHYTVWMSTPSPGPAA